MIATTENTAYHTINKLRNFLSRTQYLVLRELARGSEAKFFTERLSVIEATIEKMPVTYDQDGKGDAAIAHLHYFIGGSDFYIIEKDVEGEVEQATGYASINGGDFELGYISIREIVEAGAELDLHWTPAPISQVTQSRT